jgi:hypothetical protein
MANPGGAAAGAFGDPPVATICRWFTMAHGRIGREGQMLDKLTGKGMKSFWTGAAIAVIIAVVAGVALNVTGQTSAQKFSTSATRLGG